MFPASLSLDFTRMGSKKTHFQFGGLGAFVRAEPGEMFDVLTV